MSSVRCQIQLSFEVRCRRITADDEQYNEGSIDEGLIPLVFLVFCVVLVLVGPGVPVGSLRASSQTREHWVMLD